MQRKNTDTRPVNTLERFYSSLPKSHENNSREIVAELAARAAKMKPYQANEMLKRRIGVDLDPDVIPGLDDGCGPKTYRQD